MKGFAIVLVSMVTLGVGMLGVYAALVGPVGVADPYVRGFVVIWMTLSLLTAIVWGLVSGGFVKRQADKWRPTGHELRPVEIETVRYEAGRIRGSVHLENLRKDTRIRARNVSLVVLSKEGGAQTGKVLVGSMDVVADGQSREILLDHALDDTGRAFGEPTLHVRFKKGVIGGGLLMRTPGGTFCPHPPCLRKRGDGE